MIKVFFWLSFFLKEEARVRVVGKVVSMNFKVFFSAARHLTAPVLMALMLAIFAAPSQAGSEVTLVKSRGLARADVVSGAGPGKGALRNEYKLKKLALDDAFRDAIAEALTLFLDSDAIAENEEFLSSEIYPQYLSYVLNYKILSMGWATHFDLPRIEEEAPPGEARGGPGNNDDEGDEEGAKGGRSGAAGGTAGGVRAYHINIEARVDLERLRSDVGKSISISKEELRRVVIVVLGVEDYGGSEALKKRLIKNEFVRVLNYRTFLRGRFVFDVDVTGSFHDLFEGLRRELAGEFTLMPAGGGWGTGEETLIIKAANMGRAR